MGKLRCLPHSDHRGARCAPVTLRSLLWRNLRQSPPLRDDASIVPYKSCATFAAHGKAEFLCGGVHPYPLQGKIRFQHAEKKSDLYFPVNRALHFYVMLTKPAKTGELNASCRAAFESNIILLWQHRTIPALRLKHRSGSCGTASALPKCSIMSGCGTRIVLRGQKPLALCDRCPCFGSLLPPLAALTFAASSIICAFGLASATPRSPYRHLELCGIAL